MNTKRITGVSFLLMLALFGQSQNSRPFIKLVLPVRESNVVRSNRQFISGSTCPGCELTINGDAVKVYSSGGFAYELNLNEGENSYQLQARSAGNVASKRVSFRYTKPAPPDTVKTLDITSIDIQPAGNMMVQRGDRIFLRVKAMPGAQLWVNDTVPLREMATSPDNPIPGIYQGEYVFSEADSAASKKLLLRLRDSTGASTSRYSAYTYTMLPYTTAQRIITKGRLAHLLYGIGEDRLGGAKMGYIDSLIPLRVTGKVKDLYRVQLTRHRTAWIPDDVVEWLPSDMPDNRSLTGNWRVYGDSAYDYVKINLESRLPYQSLQELNPSRIIVDIFGATNNTNWITQLDNVQEIENVRYEQIEDEVLRVTIDLKHRQHWGHAIYYEGTRLVVRVKPQPKQLDLRHLRIAVDAGHGGSNTGAGGPTGSIEKELALAVALKLKRELQYLGAHVMMTRSTESFVDNKERILLYRDSLPDLLISLHLNSSGDPINVAGTGTFYKYPGFRPLSHLIYRRMLELGLPEYGNTGGFNFMLNSPTEYPNALVEMLFISNPAEEDLILKQEFQQEIARKITDGIRDFLRACAADATTP